MSTKKPGRKPKGEPSQFGAPRRGNELRQRYSVRMEPSIHEEAVRQYGSFTDAVEVGFAAIGLLLED